MANMVQSTRQAEAAINLKVPDLETLYLGLYKNPSGALTPTILDNDFAGGGLTEVTSGDLTGYARIAVTPWGAATSPAAGQAQTLYGDATFTFTAVISSTDIKGWFLADAMSSG